MSGGQFDWGGRLLKGNGGARRSARDGRQPSFWMQEYKRAWLRGPQAEQVRKQALVIRRPRVGGPSLNG